MFIVKIMGGLGNQIFQYNFALYLRAMFPQSKIFINTEYYKKDSIHGGYLLRQKDFPIFNKFDSKKYKIVRDKDFDEAFATGFSPDQNIIFEGYWQNTKFLGQHTPKVENLFKIKLSAKNKEYLKKITECENSVSVHIRCGDYNNNYMHGNIATRAYFQNAIAKIRSEVKNPIFFVFSNDIAWCGDNIDFGQKEVVFVTGNNKGMGVFYDIFLMSCCRHNIISNSSFSYLAQLFNRNTDKIVITPQYWVNEPEMSAFENELPSILKLPYMQSVPNIPSYKNQADSPFLSVVLLAYNQPVQIRRAISSVLNQKFEDYELIIVDDGSTDSTPDILSECAELNSHIRIVTHEKNMGRLCSRKDGISVAGGKWLFLLDGDDYLFPDVFEKFYDVICKNSDVDIFELPYIERPNGKVHPVPEFTGNLFSQFFTDKDFPVTIWNKVYNMQKAKNGNGQMLPLRVNMFDDTCGSVAMAYFCKKIMPLDFPATNYLNCKKGVSTSKNDKTRLLSHIESAVNSCLVLNNFQQSCGIDSEKYPFEFVYNRTLYFLFSMIRKGALPKDVPEYIHVLESKLPQNILDSFITYLYGRIIPFYDKTLYFNMKKIQVLSLRRKIKLAVKIFFPKIYMLLKKVGS